jgi:hypothetical protein
MCDGVKNVAGNAEQVFLLRNVSCTCPAALELAICAAKKGAE